MKKILSIFFLLGIIIVSNAQTTINGSFLHGGITRTYSFYVPATYTAGTPVPMVIGLHGTGSSGAEFAQYRDFRPIADTANFIVVHPDGSTYLGLKFWNYGNVFGSTVDDVGFLEALMDTISAYYSIDQDRIYLAGMSNGSFMSYTFACQSDRIAAIGTVTGSMSVDIYNSCSPHHPTPVLHIHGTADNINSYDGTSTMAGIDVTNSFWVNENQCNINPTITSVPDINTADGATATHYLYSGGLDGNTVELFKVDGGGHSWPGSPMPGSSEVTCMDFDANIEIWRFFSQHSIYGTNSLTTKQKTNLKIWPNPSTGIINIEGVNDQKVNQILIYDQSGRLLMQNDSGELNNIDLSNLESGNYVIKILNDHYYSSEQLIIINN
ncbi:MAG: T9SS type A sorting domain-containing protein [Crocinitomicaceae bacterium]|nr:T9SS type A sorting domain-containing protein [Crocinitomicaceae bacterium]